MCCNTPPRPLRSLADLQNVFVRLLLPRIQRQGECYFRHVKNKVQKREIIAEMIALGWKWVVCINEQGKDPCQFAVTLAILLSRAVWSGRRLCGKEKAHDVMSRRTQYLNGFQIQSLPLYEANEDSDELEALVDNTRTPPPDQAAFRIDFPEWIRTHTQRNRRIIHDLMVGHRTKDVARRHGTTAGRISQLRREFCHDWRRFCGDEPLSDPAVA
jgi:hypothetical protein